DAGTLLYGVLACSPDRRPAQPGTVFGPTGWSGRAVAISNVAVRVTGAAAVVLAAGRSERLAGSVPKPFLSLAGRRVLDYSLAALGDAPSIGSIVVVVPEALRTVAEADLLAVPKVIGVVAGGPSRQGSLLLGLA